MGTGESKSRARRSPRIAGRAFAWVVAGLGGLAAGCVVAVDDPGGASCGSEGCGANAWCDRGQCVCEPGHGGDPVLGCDPRQTWVLNDSCDDGSDIEFRLFSLSRDWVWPSQGAYLSAGYGVDTALEILCIRGEVICFGGEAEGWEWGVGLDGEDACEGCCFECQAGTEADLGFMTCP